MRREPTEISAKRKRGRKSIEEQGGILSPRQEQVLRQLNQGKKYAEIAAVLCISPATVKTHVSKIYRQLGVNNKIQAVNKYFAKK